jgi:hypothetical protein
MPRDYYSNLPKQIEEEKAKFDILIEAKHGNYKTRFHSLFLTSQFQLERETAQNFAMLELGQVSEEWVKQELFKAVKASFKSNLNNAILNRLGEV